jgi:hypothetical protein
VLPLHYRHKILLKFIKNKNYCQTKKTTTGRGLEVTKKKVWAAGIVLPSGEVKNDGAPWHKDRGCRYMHKKERLVYPQFPFLKRGSVQAISVY